MSVRAIRGATQLDADTAAEMSAAVPELLEEMFRRNQLTTESVISILFTSTPDLVSCFPASAARTIGLSEVPLMCAQEIAVPNALPRVVRVMMHVETEASRAQVEHVFLRGAAKLREDLAANS